MKSSTEENGLTPYHRQKSRAALQEVEEMLKHPLSLEEIRAQVERVRLRSQKK